MKNLFTSTFFIIILFYKSIFPQIPTNGVSFTDTNNGTAVGGGGTILLYSGSIVPQVPLVIITYPPEGHIFNDSLVTVQGTANDPSGSVALVEVRLNSGNWQLANGITNWSIDLTIIPGPNTIEARAKDNQGNYSDTVSVNISYGQIYNGYLLLASQAEVDTFNFYRINGILEIQESIPGDITNLDGLSELTGVIPNDGPRGTLSIVNNSALIDVDGLSNLTSLRYLYIDNNSSLTNVDGLSSLSSFSIFNPNYPVGISITNNNALNNIDGLSGVTQIGNYWTGNLTISNNDALTNIDGLSNLSILSGNLTISDNDALTNLNGLSSLPFVGNAMHGSSFTISNNDALINLDGLINGSWCCGWRAWGCKWFIYYR